MLRISATFATTSPTTHAATLPLTLPTAVCLHNLGAGDTTLGAEATSGCKRMSLRDLSGDGSVGSARRRGRGLEPLSSARYLLRMSVGREVKEKLERAQELLSHANPNGELEQVLERALDSLLEKLEKERFARTGRARGTRKEQVGGDGSKRAAMTSGGQEAGARRRLEHIPNEVRRAVANRDGGQCTYVDGEGRRCACRAFLQLHHEQAHALGGLATLENLRLLCGPHNRLLAERDFGRSHQERFAERKSSPPTIYEC